MPYLFKKLALAFFSVGLGIAVVLSVSTMQPTKVDKESLRNLDLAGCPYDSNSGVWCPDLQKRDR